MTNRLVVGAAAVALVVVVLLSSLSWAPSATSPSGPPTGATKPASAQAPPPTPQNCDPVNCTTWRGIVNAVWDAKEGNVSAGKVTLAKVFPTLSLGEIGIFGGLLIAVAVVCSVVTIGACIPFAIGVIVGLAIVAFLLGGSTDAGQAAGSASALGLTYQVGLHEVLSLAYNQTRFGLSAMNGTDIMLSYQAAAQAITQLGNSTFNPELALAQSPVASELAQAMAQMENPLLNALPLTWSQFEKYEGTLDSLGHNCPIQAEFVNATNPGLGYNFPFPGDGLSCPQTTPGTLSQPTGFVSMGPVYQPGSLSLSGAPTSSCPEVWVQENSGTRTGMNFTFWSTYATSSTLSLKLFPVWGDYSGSGPWPGVQTYTATAGSRWSSQTLGNKTGGYFVCSPNAGPLHGTNITLVQFPMAFALDNNSATNLSANQTPVLLFYPTTSFKGYDGSFVERTISAGTLWFLLSKSTCVGSLSPSSCVDLRTGAFANGFGSDSRGSVYDNRSVYNNTGKWLWNLGAFASSAARADYIYLRSLMAANGWSPDQIPAGCKDLSPSQVIPPTFNASALSRLNASSLLTIYYAYLQQIHTVYSNSTALGPTTFCGTHPNGNLTNLFVTFGTFGYGYVYVPGATHNSNGTGTQSFGSPITWNESGVIIVSPTATNLSPKIGKTWLLGASNPSTIFIQPFLSGTFYNNTNQTPQFVNVSGPSWCIAHTTGCSHNPTRFTISPLVVGNSTNSAGSPWPNAAGSSPGYSVYLTACFSINSNGTYRLISGTNDTCPFTVTTINATLSKLSCYAQVNPDCAPNTGAVLVNNLINCSNGIPVLSDIINGISGFVGPVISKIPYIGTGLTCAISDVLGVVFVGLVIIAGIWILAKGAGAIRGRS